jgi:hypothetical protein
MLLETAVVEGEPAFRWTDFLIGTEVEAAGSDGVRFIFLIMFRFIVLFAFSAVISFRSSMDSISSSPRNGQYKFQKYTKVQANTSKIC